jgi:hypothetical protein
MIPNRVGVSLPSPEDGNILFPKLVIKNSRRWTKSRNSWIPICLLVKPDDGGRMFLRIATELRPYYGHHIPEESQI